MNWVGVRYYVPIHVIVVHLESWLELTGGTVHSRLRHVYCRIVRQQTQLVGTEDFMQLVLTNNQVHLGYLLTG